jgi:hypothetical protein
VNPIGRARKKDMVKENHPLRSRVILSEKPESWNDFFASPTRVTEDFMAESVDL